MTDTLLPDEQFSILSTITSGQYRDGNGIFFEWEHAHINGADGPELRVSRHGGSTLVWKNSDEHFPVEGPAETRLAMHVIATRLCLIGNGRRFVAVETNDLSTGTRAVQVIDTRADNPMVAKVCTGASREWAGLIARGLEQVAPKNPLDSVPF